MRYRFKDNLLHSLLVVGIFPYYVLIHFGVNIHPSLGLIVFTLLAVLCYLPYFMNPGTMPFVTLYFSFTTVVFCIFCAIAATCDYRYKKQEKRNSNEKS